MLSANALDNTFVRYVGRVCAPVARTVFPVCGWGRAVRVDTVFGSRASTASFVIDCYSLSMIASGSPLSRRVGLLVGVLIICRSVLSVIVTSAHCPWTAVVFTCLRRSFRFPTGERFSRNSLKDNHLNGSRHSTDVAWCLITDTFYAVTGQLWHPHCDGPPADDLTVFPAFGWLCFWISTLG